MSLIGRNKSIEKIKAIIRSKDPEFLAIYGRRRIGKTYLVRETTQALKEISYFEFSGQHKASLKTQLKNFKTKIEETFDIKYSIAEPKNWNEAFKLLTVLLNEKTNPEQTKVIFLDELPWICSRKSNALADLVYYWNSYWSKDKKFKLIVCGSAASWMIEKIVKGKGGIHNRLTDRIHLEVFNLSEFKEMLDSQNVKLTYYDLCKLYMVTGGVPYYLKAIKPGLSLEQTVQEVAFDEDGLIRNENKNLIEALFENAEDYKKIVKTLGESPEGKTRTQILKSIKKSTGGVINKKLEELEICGFIEKTYIFNREKKDLIYRLRDEYLRFYYKWMRAEKDPFLKNHFAKLSATNQYQVWCGFSFERVCSRHLEKITEKLKIEANILFKGTWKFLGNKNHKGAQIDWLIDRSDNVINIIEIKFCNSEFIIDKEYFFSLSEKIKIFKEVTKTKKNIFLVMVTPFGVSKNPYSNEILSQQVLLEDLF